MQYYEALGLEPTLTIDPDDLKQRFYERSRQWHPDRFSRAGAEAQQKALDMTAALNDAFRTLRDPVARVEYFLAQHGIEPSKTPPPELLEEVFELNMALEELRDGDEAARSQLTAAREKFVRMQSGIDLSLVSLSEDYDTVRKASRASTLVALRDVLDRRRYISNLLRDVNKELNPDGSNSTNQK